ncbi:hypothetical protein ACIPW9_26145 [Streptomyces sp. NPDC090052]|uniref:hypothetical protein n=1 Tax=Streptomyces sp. NPDC090052 TaxID=3365931 RepID=UPI00381E4C3F
MKAWAPGGTAAGPVEVTSTSVMRGDVIQIGGTPCRVTDLFQLPGGLKRLHFESGELLTIHTHTRLIALRVQRRR